MPIKKGKSAKPLKRHLVLDRDTGKVLSRHKRLDGPSSAKVWLKGWRDAGFNAIIGYAQ